jgi:C4-dicarboxylate-specific signal transduction histidine kinase
MIAKMLRNRPIRTQLLLIIMTVSGAALTASSCMWLSYEVISSRRLMEAELSVLAEVIAANSAAAVSFLDRDAAAIVLGSLSAQPQIAAAYTIDGADDVFARYVRAGAVAPPLTPPPGWLVYGYITAEREILVAGQRVGSLRLIADTGALRQRVLKSAGMLLVLGAAALVLVFLMSKQMAKGISARVKRLADAAKVVSVEADYRVRVEDAGGLDELGVLVGAFNDMLVGLQHRDAKLASHRVQLEDEVERRTAELSKANQRLQEEIHERERGEEERAKLHRQLIEASRHAGMAEVATNVLHNVGNVLNSVNVSCSLIAEKIQDSRIEAVAKAAELLAGHVEALPPGSVGRKLPEYLAVLALHLTKEREDLLVEAASLRRNLEHIKEIVVAQQSHAGRSGALEPVHVHKVLEDAVGLSAGVSGDHIEIVREYALTPEITVDRHSLLGILANLVRNAKQAVNEANRTPKKIVLRVDLGENASGFVRVQVSDSGVGIPPNHLTRIFSHGFTTKKGGHGFGLHGAALTAKELGGSLSVASDGPDRGATFTLLLPLRAGSSGKEA